jgi:hypothetical protein
MFCSAIYWYVLAQVEVTNPGGAFSVFALFPMPPARAHIMSSWAPGSSRFLATMILFSTVYFLF